ncbi:hypothetical protein BN129_4468 [Cronobacter sakazakii 701]|nr:hypothetical protein BN129_4468 [Cronobacter sakazakii 701]
MKVASERLLTNFSPKVSSSMPKSIPTVSPVVSPATTTTSSGLKRSAKPITTTGIPMSGNREEPSIHCYPFQSERCTPKAILLLRQWRSVGIAANVVV